MVPDNAPGMSPVFLGGEGGKLLALDPARLFSLSLFRPSIQEKVRQTAMLKHTVGLGLSLAAFFFTGQVAVGLSFVCGPSYTIRQRISDAPIIIYGTFQNPRQPGPAGVDSPHGTTELHILKVLKGPRKLKGRRVVTIAAFIEVPNPQRPPQVLCPADWENGAPDLYDPIVVTSARFLTYCKGLLALAGKPNARALLYFSRYLNDPDPVISEDAYSEFMQARYEDLLPVATGLAPERVAGWLKDPRTPTSRYHLYGKLLGLCGTDKHARLLRQMLAAQAKRSARDVYGLMVGYILLRPKEGLAYLRDQFLAKPEKDFCLRYDALRALRFFAKVRPDKLPRQELVNGLGRLLDHPDMADFAIEELRQWKDWSMTDKILAIGRKHARNKPIGRAVLLYALCCPRPGTRAEEYLRAERVRDRENVEDLEDLVKIESDEAAK
jgi:hypothetical protein